MTAELQRCWVAGVVRDEVGQLLVVRNGHSQAWDLPAGVLRQGEDPVQGLHRVVAECATVGVSAGWLLGLHSHVRDGMTLVFGARHVAGRAVPQGDVQQCRWVSYEVAVRMLWPRRAEQLIAAADSGRSAQPVVVVAGERGSWAAEPIEHAGGRFVPLQRVSPVGSVAGRGR